MSTILAKLNRRFTTLRENENHSDSWKDPNSPDYDRQWAEDALFHTIGPLTDNPVWNTTEWASPSEPVPGWSAGGPSPQWTPEEIVYAMAGDPDLLFKAKNNPRSPGYGNKGGSPLYRTAVRVAGWAGKGDDNSFIEDLYSNGFIPLAQMMQPGYDESRSPFISYAVRTIESAMAHGTGGSTSGKMAGSERSQFFTNPEGQFRKRRPEGVDPEGWTEHTAIGVPGILAMKNPDPKEVREAANIVQGKYQQERHYDKHPQNPFGLHSPKYFMLVNQYADAIEAENEEQVDAARSQLQQFSGEIDDSEIAIRGASTGLGQAISTPDRAKGDTQEIFRQLQNMKPGDTAEIGGEEVTRVDEKYAKIRGEEYGIYGPKHKVTNRLTPGNAVKLLSSQGVNVQSVDVEADDGGDGGTAAGNLESSGAEKSRRNRGQTDNLSWIDPESMHYVLDLAMNYSLADLVRQSDKYNKIAIDAKAKVNKATGKAKIGGPMGANELRYLLRAVGPLASKYPGKDHVRAETQIPRDGRGWWQVGEDPEIEPIPSGEEEGMWHSAWKRNEYPVMGPTEIANEMTAEVLEFKKLGIESARWPKVKSSGSAVSKVSVSNQLRDAKVKITILTNIHKDQLGMDIDESIQKMLPIMEDIGPLECDAIVATCEGIIERLDRQLMMEDAPPGWKGTVKKMKGKKDIDNPFALTWSMHKKGAEPHYEDTDDSPQKVDEGMRPVDSLLYEEDEEEPPAEEEKEAPEEPTEEEPEEFSPQGTGLEVATAVGNKARRGSAGRRIPGL